MPQVNELASLIFLFAKPPVYLFIQRMNGVSYLFILTAMSSIGARVSLPQRHSS